MGPHKSDNYGTLFGKEVGFEVGSDSKVGFYFLYKFNLFYFYKIKI
jgi:hypothetical protein